MTIVKICGLTRVDDVLAAAQFGADWLGFIHVPGTPRFVDIPHLKTLLAEVPKGTRRVLVVRNAAAETLVHLRQSLDFDDFQFHGQEPESLMLEHAGYPVIGVRGDQLTRNPLKNRPILLDTLVGKENGGTGKTFDWRVIERISGDVLVAGGLRPDNVAELITHYRPWGVDVSSGVESAPGVKDHGKLQTFIETVRSAAKHER